MMQGSVIEINDSEEPNDSTVAPVNTPNFNVGIYIVIMYLCIICVY